MDNALAMCPKSSIPMRLAEVMFLRIEQTEQELANLEDESEDDLKLLGNSHPKGTPSSLKILRSELELKEGEFRTLV